MGPEGEDGGAGQWGLQSPGRGSHPPGWGQVNSILPCNDMSSWVATL